MKTQPITLALILGALPLAAGKPSAKPAAVKKVSVDEVMALSAFSDFKVENELMLKKLRHSPRLTRNYLLELHQALLSRKWSYVAGLSSYIDSGRLPIEDKYSAITLRSKVQAEIPLIESAIEDLKALKF